MNLAQLTRLAQYQAELIKQSGVAGASISAYELDTWANRGNELLERALRNVQDDYFVKRMVSTDTTAQTLEGISYTPTTLALAASTQIFTLPPDFLTLKGIKVITSGYEDTPIEHTDLSTGKFQGMYRSATTETISPGERIYFDIYGARTLLLAQPLQSALDIEILYVAKTKKLVRYSTGTIAVTDATTAVTGVGTVWTYLPLDDDFLDIHFGGSGVATVPTPEPSYEYDGVNRLRVSSITDATHIVLGRAKVGTLNAGTGYLLASVPQSPDDLHTLIADYVTYRILRKARSTAALEWRNDFYKELATIASPISRRQITDIEVVEGYRADEIADERMD